MSELKKLRLEKGYSQAELARLVGVTPKYIGFIENNERMPSLNVAGIIARIFNVSIEEIFLPKR